VSVSKRTFISLIVTVSSVVSTICSVYEISPRANALGEGIKNVVCLGGYG
jgi:hypothetical protein